MVLMKSLTEIAGAIKAAEGATLDAMRLETEAYGLKILALRDAAAAEAAKVEAESKAADQKQGDEIAAAAEAPRQVAVTVKPKRTRRAA
jgi:hypothetical protein